MRELETDTAPCRARCCARFRPSKCTESASRTAPPGRSGTPRFLHRNSGKTHRRAGGRGRTREKRRSRRIATRSRPRRPSPHCVGSSSRRLIRSSTIAASRRRTVSRSPPPLWFDRPNRTPAWLERRHWRHWQFHQWFGLRHRTHCTVAVGSSANTRSPMGRNSA